PDTWYGNAVSEKPAHFDRAASILGNIGLHARPQSGLALRFCNRGNKAEVCAGRIADESNPIAVWSLKWVAQDRAAIQFDLRHGGIDTRDLEIREPPHAGMNGRRMVGLHQSRDFLIVIQENRVAVLRAGWWPLLILGI